MANGAPITKYLGIAVVIVTVAAGWGTNRANLANAEEDIQETEVRVAAIEKDLGEIKTSIARSEVNQQHATKDIEQIEVMLRDLVQTLGE